MRDRRTMRAMAVGAVLAIGALVTSCSSGDPGPEPTQASTSPATSEPSPTETPLTLDEAARASLTTSIATYYQLRDLLGTDAATDLNRAYEVAQEEAAQLLITRTIGFRDNEVRQTGATAVAEELVQQLDLGEAPVTPSTAQVRLCLDYSGVDIVDSAGQSRISPDRPDRSLETLDLRSAAGAPGPWFVTAVTAQGEPC